MTLIRICALSFVTFSVVDCSKAQQETQPSATNELTDVTPEPQALRSSFPLLDEQDLKRLDERFPKRQREVLQSAERIDVFEIEQCGVLFGDLELSPIERGKFHGCRILRHTRVSDPEQRKELIEGILYSIGNSGNGAACFEPRHGIRAVHNQDRIELLICFECENFRGAPRSPYTFFGGFSPASERLFERILAAKKGSENDQ